jgi:hypothetical protein
LLFFLSYLISSALGFFFFSGYGGQVWFSLGVLALWVLVNLLGGQNEGMETKETGEGRAE